MSGSKSTRHWKPIRLWDQESRSREVRFSHPGHGSEGVGILPRQRLSKGDGKGGNGPNQFIRTAGGQTRKVIAVRSAPAELRYFTLAAGMV